MIIAQELELQQDIWTDVIFPPSDLYSDEPPVESELHLEQIMLLIKCLKWLWKDRYDFYAAGNLSIYYSPNQKKSEYFRGPDFFVVLETERKTRKSWVVWEEDGKYPNFILEILSPSTAKTDREFKKELYQNTFRTPDYFWFDPYTLEFAGFYLTNGKYQPLEPNEKGHLWSEQLGLYLGIKQGLLRYFTSAGELVPTPEETAEEETKKTAIQVQKAEIESQRAEIEFQRAEWEARRSERLAAKLRELNIDPETI
ncbi:Uma2 family endonuclease [Dolichospermum sp. ST_con]|nr:Uma2 family endonuclease [Dolichospermum sp. ST_con]MDD1417939.1 Uma2 family endonuclease [Dolichospermum sp. ST_sed1]MDD1423711.1 Uma2 family endonuclease [Dolichospermum sp. ST_sed9]MDD1431033.1 Uma2 family endonuclease [Dolichospermum sp. ST_sed6]MDD1435288.1 Uma2 family endonuclease [Dolichospermum sp. ST_sed10]MDD1439213.1 Uma2 family endonuclease [Dolichospermum sp. ST_sed3]MDD1445478.1 Uma2 family endonuclease [Dolichospermum sp. ST_sed8]MDD1453947.1 Uma2 family endonuclease [Dolic